MCGIITASGSIPFSVDKLNILFAYNESRGKDSVGFYNEEDNIPFEKRVYKKMGRASSELIPKYRWKETNLFLGHVRAATKGIVNLENCHPFVFDNIIGCHNWGLLSKEYKLSTEVDMDSKVFFDYLSTYDDYKILEEFSGAANVLWVDKKEPKKLFIFKHKDRTLFRGLIETDEGKVMYISSVELGLEAIGCKGIKAFKDQYLYEIVDGVINKTTKIKSNPRTTLSIERQKELNIFKKPSIKENKLTNPSQKQFLESWDFEMPKVIKITDSDYKNEGKLGVWKTVDLSDKTEYYFPEFMSNDSKYSGKHPVISHREVVYNETNGNYILNVYLDSGAFYEFNLGLPGIHYDETDGDSLKDLLKVDDSSITDEITDNMVISSNLIQETSEQLSALIEELKPILGENSIYFTKLNKQIEEIEEQAMDSEILMSKIINEYVESDCE